MIIEEKAERRKKQAERRDNRASTREDIKEEEYKHAVQAYNELKCKTFKDYHLAYLHSDVLLLADVLENFRKLQFRPHELYDRAITSMGCYATKN
jgi:hypothetical protein